MRFQDIKPFVGMRGSYAVDVSWNFLQKHYDGWVKDYGLDTNPNYQRGYVWTEQQKVRYCEFVLKGGRTGRELFFNCPGRHGTPKANIELVDGKQRLEAVLGFLNNQFSVFGGYRQDYTDTPPHHPPQLSLLCE